MMLKLLSLICFSVVLSEFTAYGAGTCENARTYLQSISQQSSGLAYTNPATTNNKCRLDQTCCTSDAESSLMTNVNTRYQTQLYNKLNSTIRHCLNQPIQSIASSFVDENKASTISSLTTSTQGQFTIDETIIDTFFDYLKNGITNMDLSNLQKQFQKLYFKVFLISYSEGLKATYNLKIVTNDVFEECLFNKVFNVYYGAEMTKDYNRLETRFNLFLRYIWALKTGDEVLETVLTHSLSSDCQESLMRINHCSHCSTLQDMPTNTQTCYSFCLNSLQGCFVDLEEFGDAYANYVDALKTAKNKLEDFNPFESITLLTNALNTVVFQTYAGLLPLIKSQADSMCSTVYSNRKRSVPESSSSSSSSNSIVHHNRAKRQNAQTPLLVITDSVTCSTGIKNMFQSLSEGFCQQSDQVSVNDYNCWNGTNVDSYWWEVPGKTRLEQQANPELNIRATTGLQYKTAIGQLNIVSTDLNSCQDDPRDCPTKFNQFTTPNGDDYDFGDSSQFQSFTELGFPDPVIVDVVPVAPIVSSIMSTTSTTTTSRLSTSTQSSQHTSTSSTSSSTTSSTSSSTTSSTSSSTTSSSTSSSTNIRPSGTTSSSRTLATNTPTPTTDNNIDDNHIPDPDKPKTDNSRGSGHTPSASLFILTFLILLIVSILL